MTREKYHPKCDFWRSRYIVNTKNAIFLSWLLIFFYACNNSLFNVCVYFKHFICTVSHILLLFVERLKIQGTNTWQIPYHPICETHMGDVLSLFPSTKWAHEYSKVCHTSIFLVTNIKPKKTIIIIIIITIIQCRFTLHFLFNI